MCFWLFICFLSIFSFLVYLLPFSSIFSSEIEINICVLFSFSISDVQEKNEYFWRYQRYELTCEYFEKLILAYPPLSIFAYIGWLIKVLAFKGTTCRVFSKYSKGESADLIPPAPQHLSSTYLV
jgi:hypothetical protein